MRKALRKALRKAPPMFLSIHHCKIWSPRQRRPVDDVATEIDRGARMLAQGACFVSMSELERGWQEQSTSRYSLIWLVAVSDCLKTASEELGAPIVKWLLKH